MHFPNSSLLLPISRTPNQHSLKVKLELKHRSSVKVIMTEPTLNRQQSVKTLTDGLTAFVQQLRSILDDDSGGSAIYYMEQGFNEVNEQLKGIKDRLTLQNAL